MYSRPDPAVLALDVDPDGWLDGFFDRGTSVWTGRALGFLAWTIIRAVRTGLSTLLGKSVVAPSFLALFLSCLGVSVAAGQEVGELQTGAGSSPAVFRSSHFIMHTDLAQEQAEAVLRRLESTLRFAVKYWRRPQRGHIECYIVHDLRNWSDSSLPHPLARVLIGGVGGATMGYKAGRGVTARNVVVMYASDAPGVAEHEVIHAYCAQTFGQTGPQWYKEGMAEVAALDEGQARGVRCPPERLAALRQTPLRSIREILTTGRVAEDIAGSLDAKLATRRGDYRQVSLEAWTPEDAANVRLAREEYAWSWALCYLLRNNPNYADRFRLLGDDYLTRRQGSFDRLFAPMAKEIVFEYAFFLRRVDTGYRVDLCHWDWHKRSCSLEANEAVTGRCFAARGWQAAGAQVTGGKIYAYDAVGSWSTSANVERFDADGSADGSGRLLGVVMSDFRLSKPFRLGSNGTFVAPATGSLHLRCHDAWNELGDNRGDVTVRISRPNEDDPPKT